MNCALHMIAVTQARGVGDLGKTYVDKHIAAGKTKREALRLLRRRLSDAAFTALRADAHRLDQHPRQRRERDRRRVAADRRLMP